MIKILLRNHIKRNRSSSIRLNFKNIVSLFAITLLSVLLIGIFGFILYQITDSFFRLDLDDVYLTAVFLILLIVLTVYEIVNIIKQLYQNPDNQIYMKLPIKKETIFLSKIIFIYLKQIIVSVLFLSVTAGVYGIVSFQGFAYYLRLLIIALVLPLLPLSLASLLSIPASSLIRVFKKNKTLLLIGLVAMIGVFFITYISFVQLILKFINLTSSGTGPYINPEIIGEFKNSIKNLNLSKMFYSMLIDNSFGNFAFKITILIGIIIVLTIGSYFVLKYNYFKAVDSNNERVSFSTKKSPKVNKPLISIFKKEFKTLNRNPNYAFQAIVMNLLMPVFIFYTIKLTEQAGKLAIGEEIVPGITILTILIFVLLSNSFQGTIISREKNAYYISKIIPVSPFKQLISRISFGYLLSIIMLLISIIVITVAGFISFTYGLFVFVVSVVFLFGYTFNSVYRDYVNPQLTSNEGGFDEGLNMYNTLLIGLIIAVGLGLINIALPYILKLFPHMRKWRILNLFIISLTDNRVNFLLNLLVFTTIFTYAIIGYVKLNRAVKKS